MREDLRALIALDVGSPRRGGFGILRRSRQFLPVNSEAVKDPAIALENFKCGQAMIICSASLALIEFLAGLGGRRSCGAPCS